MKIMAITTRICPCVPPQMSTNNILGGTPQSNAILSVGKDLSQDDDDQVTNYDEEEIINLRKHKQSVQMQMLEQTDNIKIGQTYLTTTTKKPKGTRWYNSGSGISGGEKVFYWTHKVLDLSMHGYKHGDDLFELRIVRRNPNSRKRVFTEIDNCTESELRSLQAYIAKRLQTIEKHPGPIHNGPTAQLPQADVLTSATPITNNIVASEGLVGTYTAVEVLGSYDNTTPPGGNNLQISFAVNGTTIATSGLISFAQTNIGDVPVFDTVMPVGFVVALEDALTVSVVSPLVGDLLSISEVILVPVVPLGTPVFFATPQEVKLPTPVWTTKIQPTNASFAGPTAEEAKRHNKDMHAKNGNMTLREVEMKYGYTLDQLENMLGMNVQLTTEQIVAYKACYQATLDEQESTLGPNQVDMQRRTKELINQVKTCEVVDKGKVVVTEKKVMTSGELVKIVTSRTIGNKVSIVASRIVSSILSETFMTENYYAVLEDELVVENDIGDEPAKASMPISQSPGFRQPGSKPINGERDIAKNFAAKEQKATTEKEEWKGKIDRKQKVINRIAGKLRRGKDNRGDESSLNFVMSGSSDVKFLGNVTAIAWGEGWRQDKILSVVQWMAYCTLESVPAAIRGFKVLNTMAEFRALSEEYDLDQAFYEIFDEKLSSTLKVLECEQKAHNRAVHSVNGNPFTSSMKDVDASPTTSSLEEGSSYSENVSVWKGSELAIKIGTIPSSVNPTQQSIAQQSCINADTVSTTNVITNDVQLGQPETSLLPRTLRNGAGATLIDSTQRLPTMVYQPVPYIAETLEGTALMMDIVDAAIKANQNLGRADNTTLSGFNALDVAYIGRLKAYYGLCMDQCLLKLSLLHQVVSWGVNRNMLPVSTVGRIDSFTQAAAAGAIALVPNSIGGGFDEDCGGATSVLPFGGGDTGRIYFHTTTTTVPADQKALAVFIPATLVQEDFDTGLGIALFCAMWADWPTLMWQINVPTLDSAGGNPLDQTFTPGSAIAYVPGFRDLHVILPRRTTARNPTDQDEANNLVIVQPLTGPALSTAYPVASTPLDVNYVGEPALLPVNMAEYFYTWSPAFDQTSISNFMQRLSYIVGIKDSLERCADMIAAECVFFPAMVADTYAASTKLAVNTDGQWTFSNSASIVPLQTTVDWPQPGTDRADMLVHSTDPVAWNKVALGLATCESSKIALNEILPEWMGNTNSVYWGELRALTQACVWSSHYANVGWTSDVWNTAYTNTIMDSFRRIVRGYYATISPQNREMMPAEMGGLLKEYFVQLTGRRPACLKTGGMSITFLDRYCPPKFDRNIVLDTTGATLNNVVPINVVDVWIQLVTYKLPKWQVSFPLPSGPDTVGGYFEDKAGLEPMFINGAVQVGPVMDKEYIRPTIRANTTRDDSDEGLWNIRIMFVSGAASEFLMNGGAVAQSIGVSRLPKQRPIVPDFAVVTPVTTFASGSTIARGRVTKNGEIIFALTNNANAQAIMRAYTRQARLSIEGWRLGDVMEHNDLIQAGSVNITGKYMTLINKHKPVALKATGDGSGLSLPIVN